MLPSRVKQFITSPVDASQLPCISEYDVYLKIKKAKKSKSSVGCDTNAKIVKTFSCEISTPISKIFNLMTKTQNFPRHWKMENGLPIQKIDSPESESDLRVISKTPFFCKIYEAFVFDWLSVVIKPHLDTDQFGMKGLSITHYLINFLHFIHSNLDKNVPNAIIAAYIDISKAFNRVDHSLLLQDLFDMQCPNWLLKIIASFLSDRILILEHNGHISSPRKLNGGTPAGSLLGGVLFIVKFNGVLLRPGIPRPIMGSEWIKVKFFDDAGLAVSVDTNY